MSREEATYFFRESSPTATAAADIERGSWSPVRSTSPERRSTFLMTRAEFIHGLANRIMYSSFYKYLYLLMTVLSLIACTVSLVQRCPSGGLIMLEMFINVAMILEVSIRFVALGKLYWKSLWNVFDIIIVLLCIVTVFFTAFAECSATRSREALLDTVVLFVRNGAQLVRVIVMFRTNRRHIVNRPIAIDVDATIDPTFSNVDLLTPPSVNAIPREYSYEPDGDEAF